METGTAILSGCRRTDRRTLIKAVCDFYGAGEKELIAMRRGTENESRDVAIYLLRTVCGEPLMQIGKEFGMTRYSSGSSAVNRIKKKRQNDDKWAEFKKRGFSNAY